MIELHPEILSKNGKKEFAVLTYEEYETLQAFLEDIEDLIDLRTAKEESKNEQTISLIELKKELGLPN